MAEALVKQFGDGCQLCHTEKKMLEFDHVIPLSEGGSDTFDNARMLCKQCNLKERNRHAKELRSRCEKKGESESKGVSTNPTEFLHAIVEYQGGTPEMQANDIGIPKLTDFWCQRIKEAGRLARFEALHKGAANCGLTYLPVWRQYNKAVFQPEKEEKPDPFAPFIEMKEERTGKRWIRLRLGFRIEKIGPYLKPVPDVESSNLES
jgi:hypothetical protein